MKLVDGGGVEAQDWSLAPRYLEGPYPFHLSQVSCGKLMAFPEALYLVIEALDKSAQRRWRVAVEVRYTCVVADVKARCVPRFGDKPFQTLIVLFFWNSPRGSHVCATLALRLRKNRGRKP